MSLSLFKLCSIYAFQEMKMKGKKWKKGIQRLELKDRVEEYCLYGAMTTMESILVAHKRNPFKDVDEIMGDLHLTLAEVEKRYKQLTGTPSTHTGVQEIIEKYS